MSWLSDAVSSINVPTPEVGGFNVNPVNLLTGTGTPIVPVNKPMTPDEKKRAEQVKNKMDAGFLAETDPAANQKYLRYLNDQYMTGFVNDPNAYEGISDAANTAARAEKIAQRNSTQTGQVNARLGKMGATKGADSLRMALENSLQNQQDLSYNDAQGAYNEWNSKVKQQMDNLANREKLGANAVQAQVGRATDMAHGWQGQIGEVVAGLIDAFAGGASVPMLAMQGYKYGMPVLAKQDSALRQALGNPAIDAANYMLNPNVSVRGLQKKVNEQGNDNSKEASKRLLIDTGY